MDALNKDHGGDQQDRGGSQQLGYGFNVFDADKVLSKLDWFTHVNSI